MIALLTFILYALAQYVVARIAGSDRKVAMGSLSKSVSFFRGDGRTPWPVIAYGMLGASLTGVTFISVPGNVWVQNFWYMPMVLGFVVGYIIVARVLLPLYYRMNLTSIYTYLDGRLGRSAYWTGNAFFFLSRLLGTAVRIYAVIIVLTTFLPQSLGLHVSETLLFGAIAVLFISLVYIMTYRGGVKSIIWTDALQTTFSLLAIVLGIVVICRQLGWGVTDIFSNLRQDINHNLLPSGREVAGYGHTYISWFDWRWADATNAVKQFISGIVVTIAMTGLDQAMMQKNLACKDLRSAQKNMYMTGAIIFAANLLILLLGALLCVYVNSRGGMGALGIGRTDEIFPMIASRRLGPVVSIFFILGLLSASFPSAAAAMTSLTGSIYLWKGDDRQDVGRRKLAQGVIALLIFSVIMIFFLVSDDAVINLVYKLASYTYGPLLGLFFFGILTKREVSKWVSPAVSVLSPLLCLALNMILRRSVGFDLGFSLLLVNGTVTFLGLLICSRRRA
ncbi:MAG: sodium:solute symporter [Bacteroidales bacterium]|nr:sodium:solute symporter [Bacteroidales bacterium]